MKIHILINQPMLSDVESNPNFYKIKISSRSYWVDVIEKYQQEKDPRIYAAIKEMRTKHKVELGVKSKEGVMIRDKDKLVERWKEYVEELY